MPPLSLELSITLAAFVAWCGEHIRGDEKGEAQLFLDHLFRAFGHAGLKEVCALYRTLVLPGKNPLRDAHAKLDAVVIKAYGFSAKADLLQHLLDLNRAVAEKVGAGDTVIAPGLPPTYPDPMRRVTADCLSTSGSRG